MSSSSLTCRGLGLQDKMCPSYPDQEDIHDQETGQTKANAKLLNI